MSSRKDAKNWMTLCKHLREAITDEQKAVPDYEKLIYQTERLYEISGHAKGAGVSLLDLRDVVELIILDEKKHKANLMPLFDKICPRMAVSRKGLERPRHHHRAMEGYGR